MQIMSGKSKTKRKLASQAEGLDFEAKRKPLRDKSIFAYFSAVPRVDKEDHAATSESQSQTLHGNPNSIKNHAGTQRDNRQFPAT